MTMNLTSAIAVVSLGFITSTSAFAMTVQIPANYAVSITAERNASLAQRALISAHDAKSSLALWGTTIRDGQRFDHLAYHKHSKLSVRCQYHLSGKWRPSRVSKLSTADEGRTLIVSCDDQGVGGTGGDGDFNDFIVTIRLKRESKYGSNKTPRR
jgi:hypothetical protein